MGSVLKRLTKKANTFNSLKQMWEEYRKSNNLSVEASKEELKENRRKKRNKRKAKKCNKN